MWFHCSRSRTYGRKPLAVQHLASLALIALSVFPAARADDRPVQIVALGDSLTAGLGVPEDAAFPAKLAATLKAKGIAATVVNAGVSGDTTTGGLARLNWSVPPGTEAVILELGANDALRGIDPQLAKAALEKILNKLQERHIPVLLAGMLAPHNLGNDYVATFDAIYPALASTHAVVFYPFFLEGVAADPKLNQGDGLHPLHVATLTNPCVHGPVTESAVGFPRNAP